MIDFSWQKLKRTNRNFNTRVNSDVEREVEKHQIIDDCLKEVKLYKAEMCGCFVFTIVMWSISRKLLINKVSNYNKPSNKGYKQSF